MALARLYDPLYSLTDFDRLFDEAFSARDLPGAGQLQPSVEKSMRPRMDLHEDDKTNTVTATFELPGLKKEDVNIDILNDVLTISGESKLSSDRDEKGYAIRERRYGKFTRSVQLPQGTKEGGIKAKLENGVLSVTFPKITAEQSPKKIKVA